MKNKTKKRLMLLLAVPMIPVIAFLTHSPIMDRWHEWKREWRRDETIPPG